MKDDKVTLKEALREEDYRDERVTLATVLLLLGFCNAAVMVLAPAYVVYRRVLDYYPFVSRFELYAWLTPIMLLSMTFGMAVFIFSVIIYVRLYNAMKDGFPKYIDVYE